MLAFPGVPIVVHADRPATRAVAGRVGLAGTRAPDLWDFYALKAYRATVLTTRPICRMYDKY